MRSWWAATWGMLVACGGTPKPPPEPANNAGAPAAELDAECPASGAPIELGDGSFHCRQLPMAVQFPPGTKLLRENQGTLAFFRADRERGVMGLIVEPRVVPIEAAAMDTMLDSLVSGLAADSVRTAIDIPPLRGATVSRGLTFTTPDGGSGVVRGYYAYHWLVAILTGGRRPEDPARPDQPVGKAFLASLQLRPLPSGLVDLALVDGAKLQIPATAWDANEAVPGDAATRLAKWYVVPDRAAALGVRAIDAGDMCTRMRLATPNELGTLVDATFLGEGLTSSVAKHTDHGVYFESIATQQALISQVVCLEPLMVQVIAIGDAPGDPLRALVGDVAPTAVAPAAVAPQP